MYVRPPRRRMRTAPSRSQVSRTAAGCRSSSLTVNVFISDILSALFSFVELRDKDQARPRSPGNSLMATQFCKTLWER